MSTLSAHLVDSYELVHGPAEMAFDPTIHGMAHAPQLHSACAQPFSTQAFQPRMGIETASKIAQVKAKLQKQLGPEYISTRPGPSGSGKLTYIEGWKAIEVANEVFDFDGWASSITSLNVDFVSASLKGESCSLLTSTRSTSMSNRIDTT